MNVDEINHRVYSARLAASPLALLLGMQFRSADLATHRTVVALPFRPELARIAGTGQFNGGAIAALADVTASLAAGGAVDRAVPTLDLRVDFLAPASGQIVAAAVPRRIGGSTVVVDVEISDESSVVVALARGVFSTRSR